MDKMTFLDHGKDDKKLQGENLSTLIFFRTLEVDMGIQTVLYRTTLLVKTSPPVR